MRAERFDQGVAPAFQPIMSLRQGTEYGVWLGLWLCAFVSFWVWWLQPEHVVGIGRFVLTSVVLAWVTLVPLYFLSIFAFGRAPNRDIAPPHGCRVAMVVTKAPSEPFPVVRETLEAMLRQRYSQHYDVWLADEDPSEETLAWCRDHGVLVSTRRGQPDYHRLTWPRRTRCKEGNLAFFYDTHGYRDYDFVCQLDADHVPEPHYLEEMLRPFNDPTVGYVSAPSICDKNADESWSARGRLYVEGALHGALQAGYSGGLAPLCIGSHYAVRTAALKQIGGLGPELAEDHSTTLLMNAGGWRGVHAINAIAHGEGPATFADLVVQEFQWSRSLTTIMLQLTPKCLARLPWRLKLQFLFCEAWYPLFALFMLTMFLIPIAALVTDRVMVNVSYPEFLIRFSGLAIVLVAMAYWWRRGGWTRPLEAKVLSWEGTLFLFARWPWALLGIVTAMVDTVRGKTAGFRVTPKGGQASELPLRVLAPYALLSIASALPILLLPQANQARGFYIFAAVNAAIYALLLVVVLVKDWQENRRPLFTRQYALRGLLLVGVMAVAALAFPVRAQIGFQAIMLGADRVVARIEDAASELSDRVSDLR